MLRASGGVESGCHAEGHVALSPGIPGEQHRPGQGERESCRMPDHGTVYVISILWLALFMSMSEGEYVILNRYFEPDSIEG